MHYHTTSEFNLVSVFWNGTNITGVPTFIYHDELINRSSFNNVSDGPGRLICRSETLRLVRWLYVNGNIVQPAPNLNLYFDQTMENTSDASLSQLSLSSTFSQRKSSTTSGLWLCGPSQMRLCGFQMRLYVGLFARIRGTLL